MGTAQDAVAFGVQSATQAIRCRYLRSRDMDVRLQRLEVHRGDAPLIRTALSLSVQTQSNQCNVSTCTLPMHHPHTPKYTLTPMLTSLRVQPLRLHDLLPSSGGTDEVEVHSLMVACNNGVVVTDRGSRCCPVCGL